MLKKLVAVVVQSLSRVRLFVTRCTAARRRKWQPTPVFLPGESQGWAAIYGVTQSWTRLKRRSSSTPGFLVLHRLPELAQTHIH